MLLARRLFQQFMVDAYAKIECERLQFLRRDSYKELRREQKQLRTDNYKELRREQKQLRADIYKELQDAMVNNDGNAQNVCQKVILPSTYCGGPRYMFDRHGICQKI